MNSTSDPHNALPPNAPPSHATLAHGSQPVLDFWFADGLQANWPTQEMKATWFGGGPALDAHITAAFGVQVRQALAGSLQAWEMQPLSRLALIVLLDQFTRHMFRGSSRAFEGDPVAQQLVMAALANASEPPLPVVCRVFLYMPLMHAEDSVLQNECVSRFTQLAADAPDTLKSRLQNHLDFARQHQRIIATFGRFPHRNAALGRTSTAAEEQFLLNGPRFGQ